MQQFPGDVYMDAAEEKIPIELSRLLSFLKSLKFYVSNFSEKIDCVQFPNVVRAVKCIILRL